MNLNNKIFYRDKIVDDVIKFNENLFSKNIIKNESIILTEFTTNKSLQAGFSLFLNSLQKKTKCKIYSYNNDLNLLRKKNFFPNILKKLNHNYKIYNSFNVEKFINVTFDEKLYKKIEKKSLLIFKKLKTKKQLLKLKAEGIWIGDLIYDTFLKQENEPTIDLSSKHFKKFFIKFLYLFYFWLNFFNKNKIHSVITSHSVYSSAIPIRIALKKKLMAFQVNFHNVFKLTNNKLFAYEIFSEYKKLFSKLDKKIKSKALKISQYQCLKRFKGKVGVDMYYSKKSAYVRDRFKQVLLKSSKKKILIASHCFLDNPHPYGIDSIFNDFYEWMNFLGRLSKKTNYEWYIKSHPDFHSKTQEIINNFLIKFPNIILLPSDTSHHNIINNGINCVLTVHGTIAWEYAYFKIPVINSSQNNPHINFDFSYHAKNKKDLIYAIKNFDKLKLNYSKKNIYKFYFMHNIYRQSNWMINDLDKSLKKIGGYKNISNFEFYKFWLKYRNKKMNIKTDEKISKFINDNNFFIPREI